MSQKLRYDKFWMNVCHEKLWGAKNYVNVVFVMILIKKNSERVLCKFQLFDQI